MVICRRMARSSLPSPPSRFNSFSVVLNISSHRSLATCSLISDKDNLECYNLTERELKIVELILAGYTNGSIGGYLDISSNTVKNHISNIYKKINVSNRYELMSIFK